MVQTSVILYIPALNDTMALSPSRFTGRPWWRPLPNLLSGSRNMEPYMTTRVPSAALSTGDSR